MVGELRIRTHNHWQGNHLWRKRYVLFSPDGTPDAATFYIGNKRKRLEAKVRKTVLGHNFNNSWQSTTYLKNHRLNRFMDNLSDEALIFTLRNNAIDIKSLI